MDAFLADHGLALLAVAACLVLSALIGPFVLLLGQGEPTPFTLYAGVVLVLAFLAAGGAWWVVGSPGDWSRVLRAVAAAVVPYAAFVTLWMEFERAPRTWYPAVIIGAALVAVGAWWAIALSLPSPLALALAVLVAARPAGWLLNLLR